MDASVVLYALADIFLQSDQAADATVIASTQRCCRRRLELPDGSEVLVDTFPDYPGASCCFVRIAHGDERVARLILANVDEVVKSPAGGWLLRRATDDPDSVVYWIPQPPAARTLDPHGRILSQQVLPLDAFGVAADRGWAELRVPANAHVDVTIWRLPATRDMVAALQAPLTIERQRQFMRSSHTAYEQLADLYLCLVHGRVYDNRFVWRRIWGGYRWRICSENEAHSLYVALNGLERATGRALYSLLKRQVVVSIIARQAEDGGWYQGEWTDLVECHFRFQNAAIQTLAAALEEAPDPLVASALEKAVSFLVRRTDKTEVGPWFLHDSLEESVENATTADAPPWTPTRVLGASRTNKLILNTHLDAIVALERYREVSGNLRHTALVGSAVASARAVLAMRPAERLYRLAYRAVRLTLLPAENAARLPLHLKVIRRLARTQLIPRLYRLKQRFPRFVMPGGYLDRHLGPKHFDLGYHTVNLMDIARLVRRFPDDGLREVASGAVEAVTSTGLLRFWLEARQHQAIGYWVEALYHLCTLDRALAYRQFLADAMMFAEDAGLGLPPALLGADPEAVKPKHQVPCPSPRDQRLRVANLSCGGRREFLVVNPATEAVQLEWDRAPPAAVEWMTAAGQPLPTAPLVPRRGWLLGQGE